MKQLGETAYLKIEKIVLAIYFLYSYVFLLNDSLLQLEQVFRLFKWGTAILGAILILYRNKGILSLKRLLFILLVTAAFYVAAKATARSYLMVYAVFILAAEGCNFDRIAKTSLFSSLAALLTLVLLCGLGLIADLTIIHYPKGEVAHCLGFEFFSYFPFVVFYCSVLYFYLRKENVNILDYAAVALVNLLMYRLTTLRLTFYLTFILIFLDFLLIKIKIIDLNKKPLIIISSLLYPLGIFATYFAMSHYNPEDAAWAALDRILSRRLSLMYLGYHQYPISFVGNRIKMVGYSALRTVAPEKYFYIDSGFAYSLLGYGLLFSIVMVTLYSILYVYACKTNNKPLFIWLTCILIFTMINNTWVDVYYNPVLMFSFTAFIELVHFKDKNNPFNRKCLL